ncbi:MAG: ASCH domain-containing protein [Pseudomonadota bacterium]
MSALLPLVFTGLVAAADAPAATEHYWHDCAKRSNVDPEPAPRIRRFGDSKDLTDRLNELILAGEKTITASSPWLYDHDNEQRPVVGGYSVFVDADGAPVGVLRTTEIKTMPFAAVTANESRFEGKGVRPIELWRNVHRAYFEARLAPLDKTWAPDMPVTLEWFEVVCE